MRYYKGHTFLCQSYFTLLFLINWKHFSPITFHMGSWCTPGVQVSQSTTVLHPSFLQGGRDTDASLRKKDNYFNE